MAKRSVLLILLAVVVIVTLLFTVPRTSTRVSAVAIASGSKTEPVMIAGPGRVEPSSEAIKIGSELSGRLKVVNVEEGDYIRRGQILAELENADYRAEVASARAMVAAKTATLQKVVQGARRQERDEALSRVNEAKAVMENAESELHRRQQLFEAGVVSQEELDRYSREDNVARAKYQAAVEQHSLLDAHARDEDRSFAEADLRLAEAQLAGAEARYQKTFICSPINGRVLRKHHRSGESVSNSATVPDPIFTVGSTDVLRIRVDVDETDVGKVRVGQAAYVMADAFPGKKFWGRVVSVGQELGPKNVHTDEPSEKVDTKILETLIELKPESQLPDGLRVDAFIIVGGS